MKRFVLIVVAILLTVAGIGLLAIGGMGIRIFGTSGQSTVTLEDVESRAGSVALVADIVSTDAGIPFAEELGEVALGARSTDGWPVFVGLGAQADVDDYLFGRPYDVLNNAGGSWDVVPVPGVTGEIDSPQLEDFWIIADTGTRAAIPVDRPDDGERTMVIMNGDGSPGVAVALQISFTSDRVFPLSMAALAFGAILLVTGLIGMARWGRSTRNAG